MREILFHGKRVDNGEWVEGFYFQKPNPFSEDGLPVTHAISDIPPFGYDVVPETIGQYTGLTDENGKKIFEGDLCLCDRNINDRFDKTVFAIKYDKLIGFYGENEWGGNTISAEEFCMCEIVGNVFDNPELLEVGK